MANPLLEFVLSLVRDPEAAARYAADPERAIADAHLTDVTRVDVNSLIPVVSESMSAGAMDDNVWTSGQAVSAFDAFGDELPAQITDDDLAGRALIDTSMPDMPDRLGAIDDPFVTSGALLGASDEMPTSVSAVDDAVASRFDDGLDAVPAALDSSDDPGDLGVSSYDLDDLPGQTSGFDAFGQ